MDWPRRVRNNRNVEIGPNEWKFGMKFFREVYFVLNHWSNQKISTIKQTKLMAIETTQWHHLFYMHRCCPDFHVFMFTFTCQVDELGPIFILTSMYLFLFMSWLPTLIPSNGPWSTGASYLLQGQTIWNPWQDHHVCSRAAFCNFSLISPSPALSPGAYSTTHRLRL